MCQVSFYMLHTHRLMTSWQYSCEVSIIVNLTLQMKELRHREVKQCVQCHTGNNRKSRMRSLALRSSIYALFCDDILLYILTSLYASEFCKVC